MAQLKQLDFVKTSALTEMAYTVVNTVWPDVETYLDSYQSFNNWIATHVDELDSLTEIVKDDALQKFLFSYFKKILAEHKFHLHYLTLTFSFNTSDNWGSADTTFIAHTKNEQIIPLVQIKINVNRLNELDFIEFKQTLFHELTHIEQQCKALSNFTPEALAAVVEPNVPISVTSLMDGFSNKKDLNSDGTPLAHLQEIGAYANDFALKLFAQYKQLLKSRSPEERDLFLRTEIIPNYSKYMSEEMKEHFEMLPHYKKNSFLKQMVRQLKELTNGLL
jgi:hypothetical protein